MERIGEAEYAVMEVLWQDNIMARRYFYPGCHNQRPYVAIDPFAAATFVRI